MAYMKISPNYSFHYSGLTRLKQASLGIALKLEPKRGHFASALYRFPLNQPVVFFGQLLDRWFNHPFSQKRKVFR